MSRKRLLITLITVFFAFAVQTGFAQEKKDEFKVVKSDKETELIQNSNLAMNLVDFGYANKSAISLVQAADIFSKHPMGKLQIFDKDGKPAETTALAHSYEPSELLTDAKFFAKNNAELLAYIEKAEKDINKQTKAETQMAGTDATIYVGAGSSRTVTLDASPLSGNRIVARSHDYANLRICVGTAWEDKGCASGTRPAVNFLLGISCRVSVTVTNLENYSTNVDIMHYTITAEEAAALFE